MESAKYEDKKESGSIRDLLRRGDVMITTGLDFE